MNQSFTKYILLALLVCITTLLIGIHANWLWGATALLVLAWSFIIGFLIFNRPSSPTLDSNILPGDPDNLDKLYRRAIQYCDDIIEFYQGMRYRTRRYFIFFQLTTAALTGLTPILVLVDKAGDLKQTLPPAAQIILTWSIIIVPGIAAILATTSTIFNFQEDWIQAKKTAESLEAIREEFMIGASPHYQITAQDAQTKQKQQKQALENFIINVNELHLQQIDRWASLQRSQQQQRDTANPDGNIIAQESTFDLDTPTSTAELLWDTRTSWGETSATRGLQPPQQQPGDANQYLSDSSKSMLNPRSEPASRPSSLTLEGNPREVPHPDLRSEDHNLQTLFSSGEDEPQSSHDVITQTDLPLEAPTQQQSSSDRDQDGADPVYLI